MDKIPEGTEIEGTITKYIDKRFLSSIDIIGLGDIDVTIDRVEFHETLKYLNGKTDENALLIYFNGSDKPLKLCKTNVKKIISKLGTAKVKDWKDKKITIAVESITAFKKTMDAVRVQ